MKCLTHNLEVNYPCSPVCPLFGDCVVAFRNEQKKRVRTNADRIRAMSDEELAQEILRRWRAEMETREFEDISTRWCDMKGGCVSSKGYHRPCTEDRLLACIKRWLRQPAEAQT